MNRNIGNESSNLIQCNIKLLVFFGRVIVFLNRNVNFSLSLGLAMKIYVIVVEHNCEPKPESSKAKNDTETEFYCQFISHYIVMSTAVFGGKRALELAIVTKTSYCVSIWSSITSYRMGLMIHKPIVWSSICKLKLKLLDAIDALSTLLDEEKTAS